LPVSRIAMCAFGQVEHDARCGPSQLSSEVFVTTCDLRKNSPQSSNELQRDFVSDELTHA